MNKLMKRVKNRKGFTLVEIIVVLVIIAILLAALAPVMIGWIREARIAALIEEGRAGLQAAQLVIGDAYARDKLGEETSGSGNGADLPFSTVGGSKFEDLIENLDASAFTITWVDGQITRVVYGKDGAIAVVEWNLSGDNAGWSAQN